MKIPIANLTQSGANHLLSQRWPGNIRELENTIQRANNHCQWKKH